MIATKAQQTTAQPPENLTFLRAVQMLGHLDSVNVGYNTHTPHTSINLPAKELKTIFAAFPQKSNVPASTVYRYFLDFAAKDESEKYFYERIKQAFGEKPAAELLAAAASHGITPHRKGIAITPRHFDGTPFIYETENNGQTNLHTFQIIRNTPLYTKFNNYNNKPLPKYLTLSKKNTGVIGVPAQPNNVAIENFNSGVIGGTVYFTEGYFKALFLSLCGIECVSFNGKDLFFLTPETEEYLTKRQPSKIVVLFDGDATNISSEKNKMRFDNNRLSQFFTAVERFTSQLFEIEELKKTSFFYSETNKTAATQTANGDYIKAFDDLIIYDRSKQGEIVDALESLKTNDFFKFLELKKSKYTKDLKKWFSLDSYRNFYKNHIEPQGKTKFSFDSVQYEFKNNVPFLNSYPFFVDCNGLNFTVSRYVGEVAEPISSIIRGAQITAINAPTGSGKTTAAMQIGKALKRQIVVCVPLRSIASQQANHAKLNNLKKQVKEAKKQNVDFALFQGGEITNRYGTLITATEASKKEVIFCTYDMLHKVRNLQERILFIDEAHELIDAYSYRNNTLLNLYTLLKSSFKTVLLSGTMPTHLVKLLDATLINILPKTLQNKVFEIHETKKSELISTFLHLLKNKKNINGVDVVLINDTEKLKEIKNMLINSGEYLPQEIAIFSRSVIDSAGSKIYDQLLTDNILNDVKLVLTTSIIKQGINVNNTVYQPENLFAAIDSTIKPINAVYTIGINDANELLQFAARFRKMETVFIYSILQQERNINKDGFLYETEIYTAEKIKTAQNFANFENSKPARTKHSNNFIHPLNDDVFYNSIAERWDVDILKILYKEKQRKIKYGNNAALFTELSQAQNTTVIFAASDTPEPAPEFIAEVSSILKKSAAERTAEREKYRTDFLSLCEKNMAHLIIDNLYLKAKEHRNLEMLNAFDVYYYQPQGIQPPSEPTSETAEFYEEHKTAFKNGYFTKIVKYFIRLNFWQCDDLLNILRDSTDNDLKLMCDRFNAISKGNRTQKAGAQMLKKKIKEIHGQQNVLSFREFVICVRLVFGNQNENFTPSEIQRKFKTHFHAEKITKFSFINFTAITAKAQKDGLKINIGNDIYLLKNAVYCEF